MTQNVLDCKYVRRTLSTVLRCVSGCTTATSGAVDLVFRGTFDSASTAENNIKLKYINSFVIYNF